MVVLISGANGFIGGKIAERFIDAKVKVAAIDRNLFEEPAALKAYCEKVNPTYIFHTAAYGNKYDQKDVNETISTNYLKTYLLLQATKHIDYRAFINFSTSSVYGYKFEPMSEVDVLEPNTFYAATKAAAEHLCRAYTVAHDKNIINVRPFTVTGVGEQKEHLIPTLIRSCLHNEKMDFDGKPVHDYIDVYDLIDAVLVLCDKADYVKGQSFNVGSGQELTNLQVKEMVEDITLKKANIRKTYGLRTYDTIHWRADIGRMRALGWKPNKPLDTTLREMVEYAKQRDKASAH